MNFFLGIQIYVHKRGAENFLFQLIIFAKQLTFWKKWRVVRNSISYNTHAVSHFQIDMFVKVVFSIILITNQGDGKVWYLVKIQQHIYLFWMLLYSMRSIPSFYWNLACQVKGNRNQMFDQCIPLIYFI